MPLRSRPIGDLGELLRRMQPVLNPGRFAFVTLPPEAAFDLSTAVACIREPEGLSVVLPEPVALARGLHSHYTAAWITLTVHSDLAAVGLTAAFSHALAGRGISCNVIAGNHHDHLFVPIDRAEDAMAALLELQRRAGVGGQ